MPCMGRINRTQNLFNGLPLQQGFGVIKAMEDGISAVTKSWGLEVNVFYMACLIKLSNQRRVMPRSHTVILIKGK